MAKHPVVELTSEASWNFVRISQHQQDDDQALTWRGVRRSKTSSAHTEKISSRRSSLSCRYVCSFPVYVSLPLLICE